MKHHALILSSIFFFACGGGTPEETFDVASSGLCPVNRPCEPPEPEEPPPMPLPNLRVEMIDQPDCYWGSEGWLMFEVWNNGAATAGPSKLRVQNYPWGDLDLPSLAPGGVIYVYLWYAAPPPPYSRVADIDATNAVTEYNEGDNRTGWGCSII